MKYRSEKAMISINCWLSELESSHPGPGEGYEVLIAANTMMAVFWG